MSGSAGGPRNYNFRISAEGMGEFVRDLRRAAGESSAANAAIEALVRSSPQLASALSTSQQQVDAMAKRAAELREQTDRAADAARTMGEQQQRLSERLGGLEARTLSTRRAVADLRGAMELLGAGGVAESLGPVAGAIGNVADLFGTASLAARGTQGVLGSLVPVLGAVTAAIGGGILVWQNWDSIVGGVSRGVRDFGEQVGVLPRLAQVSDEALRASGDVLKQYGDLVRRARGEVEDLAVAQQRQFRQNVEQQRNLVQQEQFAIERRLNQDRPGLTAAVSRAEERLAAFDAGPRPMLGADFERAGLVAELERARRAYQDRVADLEGQIATRDTRVRELNDLLVYLNIQGPGLFRTPERAAAPAAPRATPGAAARPELPDPFATIYEARDGTVFPAAAIEPPLRAMRERAEREAQQLSERLAREAERQATANQRRFDSLTERFSDRLTDGIVNAFEAGAMRGENLFASLASGFGTILRAALAQSLSAGLVQPGVSAVLSGIGYTGAESGPGSMWSSVGSLTGLSGLLPAGGMAGMAEAIGLTSGNSLFGIGTTHSFALNPVALSSVLAAAGLGALGGGVLASVTGGNAMGGSLGGGLGAGAGFALASAGLLGPVGPVLAAVLGGAGGGLLGGMFGGGGRNPDFSFDVGVRGGGLAILASRQKWAGEDLAAALGQAQQQVAAINALLSGAGITARGGDTPVGPAQGNRSIADVFRTLRFGAADARLDTAIGGRAFASPEELAGVVQAAQGFIAVLDGFAQAAGDAADPLAAIRRQFDGLRQTAERLGFGLEEVNRQQERALDIARQQQQAAALSLGLRQSRILSDFLAGRDLATGSPASQLEAAQAQFGSALAAARGAGGQGADLSRVTSSAEALLRANSAFNATGPAANALEAWVRTTLQSLGRDLDLPGFAADPAAAVERWGRAQVDQLAALNTAVAGMREELQQIRLLQQRAA